MTAVNARVPSLVWQLAAFFSPLVVVQQLVLAIVVSRALKRPLDPGTPRMVYKAFEVLYNVCYVAAVSGFMVVGFEFFTAFFTILHLEIVPISAFVVFATGE
jgi:hypothetical protein